MTAIKTHHETLTFERCFSVSKDAVFEAFRDVEMRAVWSAPSDSAVVRYISANFQVGHGDVFRCGDRSSPQYEGRVHYHDIVTGTRIVYSEVISVGERPLSASLVTWELSADGFGSRLIVTDQIASFVGDEMIEGSRLGMNAALTNLVATLDPGQA